MFIREYPNRKCKIILSPLLNDVDSLLEWQRMQNNFFDRDRHLPFIIDELGIESVTQQILNYNKK